MQKSKKKIYLSISMYSLHLNYYLLTISVSSTSQCVEIRGPLSKGTVGLGEKKNSASPEPRQDREAAEQGVCTEHNHLFATVWETTEREDGKLPLMPLAGLSGSCIQPVVILNCHTYKSQSNRNWYFRCGSRSQNSCSTAHWPWAFSVSLAVSLSLKFNVQ